MAWTRYTSPQPLNHMWTPTLLLLRRRFLIHPHSLPFSIQYYFLHFYPSSLTSHNIIQPRGSVPWPWNMSIILYGPPKQNANIHLLFIFSRRHFKIWMVLYSRYYSHESLLILTLFTRNIVHLYIIHWKYYRSNMMTKNINITHHSHILHTSAIPCLYWCQFLLIF
jgi:hypothetical protein